MTGVGHNRCAAAVPARAGIGLRAPHYRDILEQRPAVGWLEAHSENFFGRGGAPLACLERLRADYPLSLHGVGLSLGSTDALSVPHLKQLKVLVERFEPGLVSEHLSWSSVDGVYLNDLLPLPYTQASLTHVAARIEQVQEHLGRQLLIENPSGYLGFDDSTMSEPEFLTALVQRSGCALLLDVNNVFVSAHNLGWDARTYLASVPSAAVHEIHLAGHSVNRLHDGREVLIDDHGGQVSTGVWALFAHAVRRLGSRPTLIEWDSRVPPLAALVQEAGHADAVLAASDARVA